MADLPPTATTPGVFSIYSRLVNTCLNSYDVSCDARKEKSMKLSVYSKRELIVMRMMRYEDIL